MQKSEVRAIQPKGIANAKSLRQEYACALEQSEQQEEWR